jgi:hypothetical protein
MILEILLGVALLVLLIVAAFDVYWPLTVALVASIAATWWFGIAVIPWLWNNPLYIAGYLIAALIWIFFKWTRLVEKEFRYHKSLGDSQRANNHHAPKWSDHSYDYLAYFFFWPFDLVAYILSDVLRDLWNLVSRMVSRSFDRYAEWRFSRVQ